MIEPTDEMLAAFQAAWDHENRVINDCPGEYVESGARDRAGLAAVLAIVERDYRVEPRPPWESEGAICPVHHTQLRWGQCTDCGLDEDDS